MNEVFLAGTGEHHAGEQDEPAEPHRHGHRVHDARAVLDEAELVAAERQRGDREAGRSEGESCLDGVDGAFGSHHHVEAAEHEHHPEDGGLTDVVSIGRPSWWG